MDRLEAMRSFVVAVEDGSLAAAGRRLGHSPAAMTRALESLERRLGARLLQRTTRSLNLTRAGERYFAACRQVLAELAAAERAAQHEEQEPRGLLTITAPATFGRLHVRPVVDAFLASQPGLRVRLLLLDRVIDLVAEGIDAAIRIGQLPDSSLRSLKVGDVRSIAVASPDYIAYRGRPVRPQDLLRHDCIVFAGGSAGEAWSFARPGGGRRLRLRLEPRLSVNDALSAVASATEGHGITRVLSYQAETALAAGQLVRVLKGFEPPPLPVQIVTPPGRVAPARIAAFTAFAAPALRRLLARIEGTLAGRGRTAQYKF